jgi:hypothetical protein
LSRPNGDHEITPRDRQIRARCIKLRYLVWAAASPHLGIRGVRSENTPKVRFSATVGEEPEVEVALV